jgi:hypothetical protein
MILLSALSTIARACSFSMPNPILYPIAIGVRTEMSATISACVNVVVTEFVIGLPFGFIGYVNKFIGWVYQGYLFYNLGRHTSYIERVSGLFGKN